MATHQKQPTKSRPACYANNPCALNQSHSKCEFIGWSSRVAATGLADAYADVGRIENGPTFDRANTINVTYGIIIIQFSKRATATQFKVKGEGCRRCMQLQRKASCASRGTSAFK